MVQAISMNPRELKAGPPNCVDAVLLEEFIVDGKTSENHKLYCHSHRVHTSFSDGLGSEFVFPKNDLSMGPTAGHPRNGWSWTLRLLGDWNPHCSNSHPSPSKRLNVRLHGVESAYWMLTDRMLRRTRSYHVLPIGSKGIRPTACPKGSLADSLSFCCKKMVLTPTARKRNQDDEGSKSLF